MGFEESADSATDSGWKPANYPSMSPYLMCQQAEKLIGFIEDTFNGTLLRRFNREDGSLMHAEVLIDDSVVMIGGGATEAGSAPAHIHVYVEDLPATWERAIRAGAEVIQEPTQKAEDDDLRGGVQDPWSGTMWWLATQPRQSNQA
jgi:PhnB protein